MFNKREIIDLDNVDEIEYDDELAEINLQENDWSDKITDGIGSEVEDNES